MNVEKDKKHEVSNAAQTTGATSKVDTKKTAPGTSKDRASYEQHKEDSKMKDTHEEKKR